MMIMIFAKCCGNEMRVRRPVDHHNHPPDHHLDLHDNQDHHHHNDDHDDDDDICQMPRK